MQKLDRYVSLWTIVSFVIQMLLDAEVFYRLNKVEIRRMKLTIVILLSLLILLVFRLSKKTPKQIRSRRRKILERLRDREP